MADPVADDFGAGLESPGQQTPPVVNTPLTPPAEVTSDPRLEALKTLGLTVPEGFNGETAGDYLLAMQTKADKAAELEAKIAEHDAWKAQQAVQQVQQQQKPVEKPAATEEDYQFPYKVHRADRSLGGCVKFDQASGVYVPINAGSPAHQHAAEDFNKELASRAELEAAIYGDTEKFGEALTKRQIAALEKKYDAKFEEFKTQFTPIQQQSVQAQQEREMLAFTTKNYSKLFVSDDVMTPLGQEVDFYMREFGATPEVALAKAESRLGVTPPAPTKPISISKVAAPTNQASRFIDQLGQHSTNRLTEKPDDAGNGKKWKSNKDLQEEFANWGKN